MLSNNWHLNDRPELGAMNTLNSLLRSIDFADPRALPNLRGGRTILIGSDYSGQHAASHLEAFGFLFADGDRLGPWEEGRRELRERHLPNARRMSFKRLNDRKRMEALPQFLTAADQLHGLLLVVLVDKGIKSLFRDDGEINATDPLIQSLSDWPVGVAERLLRICHLVSFILAGLSTERQDVIWITDQDDIAANINRHTEFVSAFGRVASHYLQHNLGHLRIATTASDTGKRDVEDLAAIADLGVGAVSDVVNNYRTQGVMPASGVIVPSPAGISMKTHSIMNWFSNSTSDLRRLVVSFEPGDSSGRLRIRHYRFVGLAI